MGVKMRFYSSLAAAIFAFSVMIFTFDTAYAQSTTGKTKKPDVPSVGDGTSNLDFFGGVTVSSDSRSQGFTSTSEKGAISVDLGVIWKTFYFGVSVGNVEFDQTTNLNTGLLTDVAEVSVNYYAGYVGIYKGLEYDVGVTYATLPEAYDPGGEVDYFEMNAGIARVLIDDWKGGLRVYYAPEYSGKVGQNWVFEGTIEKPLMAIRGIMPTFTATLGYQEGDEGKGNFDYWFWNAGVALQLNKTFSVDLRYHDSADVPGSCSGRCDSAFVASVSMDF